MRKLIVSNFQTLDGYYESANKTFDRFFDYWLEDYGENEAFDEYSTELLRGSDTLLLSGRTSFLASRVLSFLRRACPALFPRIERSMNPAPFTS